MHVDQIFSKWNLFSKGTSQRDPDLVSLCTQIWTGPVPCAKRERSAQVDFGPPLRTKPVQAPYYRAELKLVINIHGTLIIVLFSQRSTKSASRYINFSTLLDHIIIVIKRVCYAAFRLGQFFKLE